MMIRTLLLPLCIFSTGIFQNEVVALPSIRGLSKDVLKTDQETKPAAPQVNLAESHLKELSFKQFLDFLIEDVSDEQYLEALDLRYDKKYRNSFASVLQQSNSNDSINSGSRALQGARFHRILFGVRCNGGGDCEADEVCDEATIRGVTANFCFRAGPPEEQEVSEPVGDCASGDERMACTDGATCGPTAIITKDGPQVVNRCRCREEDGYVTRPGTFMHPDIENIIAGGNLDFYGCVQVDECKGSNICPSADEGGICRDKDSSDGLYDCFCRRPNWTIAETDPVHGATKCQDVDECDVFGNAICPDNSSCENTIGGYKCTCIAGFLETAEGNCIAPEVVEESKGCDPNFNNGDSCPENNRFCDPVLTRCLCIDGLIQPSGAGGSCLNVNECSLGTDFRCDKPNAKCLDLTPTVEEPLGYSCECLPGYEDAPNEVRGTNCIPVAVEVVATPAPVAAIAATPSPVAPVPPGPTPICQTSFASQCALIAGEALCTNRGADGAPGCICDSRQFYTPVFNTSFSNGDLACQLNECDQNATICTALDPNTICVDNDIAYKCPCRDGFFLNSTSGLCQNIPCSDDTDCVLPTDPFPSTEQQRVCRQVLPSLMSAASTINPLLNGCVCNTYGGDWEIQELQEIYCVRDTCEIDSIACPIANRQTCENAPGTPGYTCVCDFGFGEDASGTCVDPCDTITCNADQVCQREESTSPPSAVCVDKNPCFEDPCTVALGGPFCVQNTTDVEGYACYCNVDTDCDASTICYEGTCTDTCDGDPCATTDSGGLCERDSLAPGGFFCYCGADGDCTGTATTTLTVCTTHLGTMQNVCFNPDSPCDGTPCAMNSQGSECTPDLVSGSPPSLTCGCSATADCAAAGENTVCDTTAGVCSNPCDVGTPCVNSTMGSFCVPDFSEANGYFCSCNDNDPSTSDNDYCDHLDNKVCGDLDVCVNNFCFDNQGDNQCAGHVNGTICTPSGLSEFTCGCDTDDDCEVPWISKCNVGTHLCYQACWSGSAADPFPTTGMGSRCNRLQDQDGFYCQWVESSQANPTSGYKCVCEDRNANTDNDEFCPVGYNSTCQDGGDSAQDNGGTETYQQQTTGTNVCTPPP